MKKLPETGSAPFQVPESYFSDLEQNILEQTVWQKKPERQGLNWTPKWSWSLVSAGLMVLLVWFFWPEEPTSNTQLLLAEISSEEIYQYLYETGISDAELLELASGDENLILELGTLPELELEEQEMNLLLDELEWNTDDSKKTNG